MIIAVITYDSLIAGNLLSEGSVGISLPDNNGNWVLYFKCWCKSSQENITIISTIGIKLEPLVSPTND